MDTETTNTQFEKYILFGTLLLLPLLVVPQFANSFITPKLLLLTFSLGIILIIKSLRSISKNGISISASMLDLPVLILGVSYVISSITQTPNKMEAFFLPGSSTLVVAGVLIFFIVNQLSENDKGLLKYILFSGTVLVALITLLASVGIFKGMGGLPSYMQSTAFTTLGGPLPALILMLGVLPIGLSLVTHDKDMAKKAFFGVGVSIVVLASLISLFNSLPGKDTSPQLAGLRTSWYVAVDSLKQSPLFGVGPGNYLTAFNRFRPISFNASDQWSVRFTSGQSFFFTALTEAGLAGGAAFLILMLFILIVARNFHAKKNHPKEWLNVDGALRFSLLLFAVALLLFPATPSILVYFFVILALAIDTTTVNLGSFKKHGENAPFAARLPVLVATLPLIVGILVVGYLATRISAADITYTQALSHIAKNDGKAAYDTLQNAINTNPYVDRYRISYAQVNLALANSLARKENITDQDKQTIAQLIQQAIREGKVAVALNPTRSGNWEVLASIYRAVMPLAQGADAFAVQTYSQAIALDPLNTNLRIALGGIYYSAKAYDDAIDIFKLAVATKPDHANAHYNLAIAYREDGNLDKAIAEMGQVLALVDKNSEDFKVATQALEDMQNKKKARETPEGGSLTSPEGDQVPALDEPIELPEDAEPPAVPTSSPSPTETSSPTPTPIP